MAVAVVTDVGTQYQNPPASSCPCVGWGASDGVSQVGWRYAQPSRSLGDVIFLNVGVCQNCPVLIHELP